MSSMTALDFPSIMLSSPHTLPQSDGCIRLCSAAPTNILNVRTLREQGSGSLSDPCVCSLRVGPNLVPRCFHFEDEGVFHMTSQCFLRDGRGKNRTSLSWEVYTSSLPILHHPNPIKWPGMPPAGQRCITLSRGEANSLNSKMASQRQEA